HKADTQGGEHTRQRVFQGLRDVADHVACALHSHAIQRHQILDLELIEVGDIPHNSLVDQLIHEGIAHAVDIHHAAGSEVQDRFLETRGAIGVDAPAGGFALLAYDAAAADGALGRHPEGLAPGTLRRNADDLRNDVAGALDYHFVADLKPEALDFVLIV